MNKAAFLAALRARLASLPQSEIEKSAAYYSEIIDDRIEEGMTEEEAVQSLEDLETIAAQIAYETPLPVLIKAQAGRHGAKRRARGENSPGRRALLIICLILGFPIWFSLLATLAAVVFTVYLVVWVVIISLFAAVLALALSALAGILGSPLVMMMNGATGLFVLGAGFLCAALAILAFYPVLAASKYLLRLTVRLGRKIKSWFIRKEATLDA